MASENTDAQALDDVDGIPDVDQQEFGEPVDEPDVLVDPDDDDWGFDEEDV